MLLMKRKRAEKGMLQKDLAKAVGVRVSTIASIEAGYIHPSVKLAKKIAMALEIDWSDLFTDIEVSLNDEN